MVNGLLSSSNKRIWAARAVAVTADVVQIALWPMFFSGAASIFADLMDVFVCGLLTVLVGWHLAFLPSFLIKVIPFADLAPTWTVAVLIATRMRTSEAPELKDR